jgi:hypothetical protein
VPWDDRLDIERSGDGAWVAQGRVLSALMLIRPWYAGTSLLLAALVTTAALGGILLPSMYAREAASWAAQGIGQDWVNLLVVAPAMAVLAVAVSRGSRGARLLLGGALLYVAYSFLFYVFAVHFNRFFLVYCACLGLGFYGFQAVLLELWPEPVWNGFAVAAPRRAAGTWLVALGTAFAALWLSQVIPALREGIDPEGSAELGLLTNPVHVLDLSFLCPLMLATGTSALRRGRFGGVMAPILLAFSVVQALAVVGNAVSMERQGVGHAMPMAGAAGAVAVVSIGLLVRFLRGPRLR